MKIFHNKNIAESPFYWSALVFALISLPIICLRYPPVKIDRQPPVYVTIPADPKPSLYLTTFMPLRPAPGDVVVKTVDGKTVVTISKEAAALLARRGQTLEVNSINAPALLRAEQRADQ